MRTFIRRLWNLFALIGIAVTGYFVLLIVLIYLQARHDELSPADAIVVLGTAQYNGTPSPVLQARLDHAAETAPWTWRIPNIDDALELIQRSEELATEGVFSVVWDPSTVRSTWRMHSVCAALSWSAILSMCSG